MKNYVITDRSTDATHYYSGMNKWTTSPNDAVWYETKKDAESQKESLNNNSLKVEEIENEKAD